MATRKAEQDAGFVCPVCKQDIPETNPGYSTSDIFPNRTHLQVCSKVCMYALMDNWLAGSHSSRAFVNKKIEELNSTSEYARPKRGK